MSRILRRPMFRGGPVDSRGTGITTGLDQPRIGARNGRFFGDTGNPFVAKPITRQDIIDAYTPRGLPQSFIDFFRANQANQRPSGRFRTMGPGATLEDSEGLLASNTMMTDGSAAGIEDIFGGKFGGATEPPVIVPSTPFDPDDIDFTADEYREEIPKLGVGSDREKDIDKFYNPQVERDTGLEAIRLENIDKMDSSPTVVKTPKGDDDEPEVTMTDLEKALGLDKARQEYAADALAAASAAFFEGKGFGAIADAAKVKSKAPDIKRLAGLEEFKAKKAKELYALKKKEFAPGNVQKTVDYLVDQGMDKDEAIKRATKQSGTFAEELSKNSVGGTILSQGFALAAETFYGDSYKGDVTAVEVINADRSTSLPDGIYSDKDNKLIFEVKDKKVVFDRSYS